MADKKPIVTRGITKKFNDISAVDDVNLEIMKGEIFGFLGPNGAGKTTLLSILSTVLLPDSGRATVNGFDLYKEVMSIRKKIGIVFQDPSLDPKATGKENLEMAASFYGVDKNIRKERIENLLKIAGLQDKADNPVKTYSWGMKRSIEIVRALIHQPNLLFLDEPTLGLDPKARENMWNLISTFEGITILLATNYIEEADRLCTRVGIIDKGKIVAVDTPDELKASLKGSMISLKVENPYEALDTFKKLDFVKEADLVGGRIILRVERWEKAFPSIAKLEEVSGIRSIELYKPSLSDVFTHYTGRSIKED